MSIRLNEVWYGRKKGGGLSFLLSLATPLYRMGLTARAGLYRSGLKKRREPPAPCVSVGNLVVGGTGKTPVTAWIADFFQREGAAAAVISRGYGGSSPGPERVPAGGGAAAARLYGDEPVLLATLIDHVPVVVARDRLAAAREAVSRHGAEILVADDAFQHWPVKRALDIVVVDAPRWFGNERLFPGGPLREPVGSIERADLVIINRVSASTEVGDRRRELGRIAPRAAIVEGDVVPAGWRRFDAPNPTGGVPPGPVHAFCGLANPEVFFRTLAEESIEVSKSVSFRDHCFYSPRDLEEIARGAEESGSAAVVTTAKDAVRIETWPSNLPLWVLDVSFTVVNGRDVLENALRRVLGGGEG